MSGAAARRGSRTGATIADIAGRERRHSDARHIACYVARKMTRYSLAQIARFFQQRDHTAVMYAIQKVRLRSRAEPDFAALVDAIEREAAT